MAVDVASLVIRVSSLEAQAAARDLDRLSTASGHADRSARQMSGGFASVGSALKGMVAQLAAVAGVAALAQSFMAANTAAGMLRASLTTVTGSLETATKAWGALQNFAAQTPFSLEQSVQAFIKLKAMGLDPSQRALMSYGNTASAMGKNINQMIEAVADAATGEFERLKEFGIKAKVEGDNVSMTFQGVTTKIGKSAKDIEGYLMKIGETQFAGAMEAQAKTLGGALSNIGDAWDQLMVTLGDTGATDAIGESIAKISGLLTDLSASLEEGIPVGELGAQLAELEAATGGWGEAIAGIGPAWQEIFTQLAEMPNYVVSIRDGALAIEEQGTAWDAVKELIIAFGEAMISLPDNLQKAVYIILGEIDILIVNFETGMNTLPLYAKSAWDHIQNIILTAWVNIKIAVAEAVAWIAGQLAGMATKMAGFFASVPEEFDIGGVAASSAAQLNGLAASLNTTKAAVAGLKTEKVALGQTIVDNNGKLQAEIQTVQASGAAQVSAIRDTIQAGIADVDSKNQRRKAQAGVNAELAIAVGEEAKLNKQFDLGKAGQAAHTQATHAGAAAHKGAAKAANEQEKALDALIKKYLPARDDAKNLEEATAVLDKAMHDGKITGEEYGKMLKGLKKDYNTAENAAQDLIDKYDTEGAKARKLAEDQAALNAIIAEGGPAAERAKVALEELGKQQAKNGKEANAWAEVWKNAVKRIDDTFASLWKDLFSGTKSTLESMKNAILSWLAEVAHALLTKPLVVAITTAMTGGGGTAGATGMTGSGGMVGNITSGISGIGSFSSIGSMFSTAFSLGGYFLEGVYSGFASIFAGTAGSALSAGAAGVASGSAAGMASGAGVLAVYALPVIIAAAAIFSKYMSDQKPRTGAFAATTHGGVGQLEDNIGVKGGFGLTFGVNDKGSANMDAEEMRGAFEGFAKASLALEQFYGHDVAAEVEATLKRISQEHYARTGILNYAMDMNAAFDVAMTQIIDAAAATGDSVAVVMKAVVGDLTGTTENMAKQIETAMQTTNAVIQVAKAMEGTDAGKILELGDDLTANALRLVDYARSMQWSGEELSATLGRMGLYLIGLDAALKLTGTKTEATGQDFIDLANSLAKAADEAKIGMEGLMQLQAAYYDHFFTEEEKAIRQKEDAYKAINAWNWDAGNHGDAAITTSADFRKYIESLDLTSEAGQKAYVEAMKMVGAFISLDDALGKLGDTAPDLVDKFEAQRKAMRDLADQLDPTDPLSQSQRDAALAALQKAGYQGSLYDAKGIAAFLRALADLDDAGGEAGAELQKFIDTFTGVFDELARIAEERAGLEMRLLELTGSAEEILAAKRQLELAATDESNRALLLRIYAIEDEAAALAKAKAAAEAAEAARRAAYDKEVQAINEYNAAAQQAADEANAAAREALQALQQAAEAAYQTANSIAQAWLEALSAVGLEAEGKALSRKLQAAAMDPALRSVYAVVWQIQDAAEKAAAQGDLAIQALGYLDRDKDATAATRRMQLAATDPSLRAMQEWVWKLEDAREAADKAGEAIQTLIDGLQAVSGALDDTIKTISDLIMGSSPQAIAQTRQAAQRDLAAQLAAAKTGKMPTTESLEETLATLGKDPSAQFGDRTAYLRDLGRTRGQLASLKGIVDKQIPIEEQNLEALKKLPVALYPNFEAIVTSIGTTGTNTGTLISQATAAVNAAIAAMQARDDAMAQSIKEIVPNLKEIPPYIEKVETKLVPLQTLAADMAANIGAIDLNVDGMVSYEEFAAFFGNIMSDADMKAYFSIFDSNGDGMIDRLELIKANTAPLLTIVDNLANKFATIDLNVDGTVTWEEFNAFFGRFADKDQLAIWYNAIDTNGDGVISELEAMQAQLNPLASLASSIVQGMSKIDLNIDGMVSYEEFTALFGGLASDTEMAAWFAALDLNGDGILDQVELIKGSLNITQSLAKVISDNLKAIDTDLDGMVSYEEYAAFFGPLATEEELAAGFALLDKNEDGILSKLELQYQRLGSMAAAISNEMAKVDLNVNGTVEYSEFATFFDGLAAKEEMQAWFDRLDADQDGLLSEAELTNAKLNNQVVNGDSLTNLLTSIRDYIGPPEGGRGVNGILIDLKNTLFNGGGGYSGIGDYLAAGKNYAATANDYLKTSNDLAGAVASTLATANERLGSLESGRGVNGILIDLKNTLFNGGGDYSGLGVYLAAITTTLDTIATNTGGNAQPDSSGTLTNILNAINTGNGHLNNIKNSASSTVSQLGTSGGIYTVLIDTKNTLFNGGGGYSGIGVYLAAMRNNLKRLVDAGAGVGGGYATGGIASGPASGYQATLHGTEAVIPLGDGNSVTAHLTAPLPNYIAQEAGDSPALRQALAELQAEIAALRGDQRAIGAATVGELKDHNKRERKRDVVPQVVEIAP